MDWPRDRKEKIVGSCGDWANEKTILLKKLKDH